MPAVVFGQPAANRRVRLRQLGVGQHHQQATAGTPTTGLILRQRYPAGSPAGADVEETFADYRDVDGLKVAFAVTVRQPQGEVTRVMRQFAVNVPLDPALFTKPS